MFNSPFLSSSARSLLPMGRNLMRTPGMINRAIDIPRASSYLTTLSPISKKFSWSGLFNGASKTISTLNQALPLYNQVRPLFNNAKTMLKMVKAINKHGLTEENNTVTEEVVSEENKDKDIIDVPIIKEETIETGPSKPFFS